MIKILPLLLLATLVSAQLPETIHSSFLTYYETKDFSDSLQKKSGVVYGVGADVHYNKSQYKVVYEKAKTDTKQPPLNDNLKVDKLFLRYGYKLNDKFKVNLNYIKVLNDNIAITDKGKAYALGVSYQINKKISTNYTQFYTNYKDFDVYQSDLNFGYKTTINDFKIKLTSLTKYISIDDKNANKFTKNAQKDYVTTGLKIHSHYQSYHFGAGAYFGKRAFAIMKGGFKIQHHAMEFNRTYALGLGKNISDFVVRVQYIYQKATELPSDNKDVKVKNLRLIVNYKF